jgi:hypothetical protein
MGIEASKEKEGVLNRRAQRGTEAKIGFFSVPLCALLFNSSWWITPS